MAASTSFMPSTSTVFEKTGENTMVVNMGPQHPSTHGVLRVICELEGETIVQCKCVIGYLHTGMEKEAEYQQYQKCVTMTDRMDYLNTYGNNLAHALAVERLLGCEIPRRGRYLRVILAELSRIASHMVWLGTHALDMGAMTPMFYSFQQRELILDLFEMMSGARMMGSWIVPGGMRGDMPEGWDRACTAGVPRRSVVPEIETLEGTAHREPDLEGAHLRRWARSRRSSALSLGCSGPILRASGHRARSAQEFSPYSGYEEFDFLVPVGERGDVYDRFLVRIAEMKREREASCAKPSRGLPEGPINTNDRKIVPPPRAELDSSMESVIHHFKLYTEGYPPARRRGVRGD